MNKYDNTLTVATFNNPVSANIILEKLKENDIKCYLANESTSSITGIGNLNIVSIELKIFEKDLSSVKEIINSLDKDFIELLDKSFWEK